MKMARRAALVLARWIARQEGAVLVAALGIVLALLGFIKIAEEVLEGDMPDFDEWLLLLLRRSDNPHLCLRHTLPLEEKAKIVRLPGNAGDLERHLASCSALCGKPVEYLFPSSIVLDLVPNEHMYHRCAPF